MATVVYNTTFKLRRGKAEAWARVNPILADGEPGYELDTNKLKVGNGIDSYNDLPYLAGEFNVSADNKSIIMKDKAVSLYGYDEAEVG